MYAYLYDKGCGEDRKMECRPEYTSRTGEGRIQKKTVQAQAFGKESHSVSVTYNISSRPVKSDCKIRSRKRNSEEVEGIPALSSSRLAKKKKWSRQAGMGGFIAHPSKEGNSEKGPLCAVKHHKQLDWVRRMVHRGLEAAKTGAEILASGHAMMRRILGFLAVGDDSVERSRLGSYFLAVGHGEPTYTGAYYGRAAVKRGRFRVRYFPLFL